MDEIRINTKRLILRHICENDAVDLFGYRSREEVYKYQLFHPENIEDVRLFISTTSAMPGMADTWYQLGIIIRNTNEFIGDIGVHFLIPESKQVELGITLKPEQQMYGYATEALSSLVDYLFRERKIHKIICSVDPRNIRSIKLMYRLGFRQEVYSRNSVFQENEWQDDIIFAILQNEWLIQV